MDRKENKVLLRVENLKQYFPVKKTQIGEKQKYVRANDGITLEIFEGETFGLVGESGCGKSTLGRTILQLYPQTEGRVEYLSKEGEMLDLKNLPKEKMRELRKEMQLIFQDPYSSLNPRMTLGQIIGEGLTSHGIYKKGDPALQEYIMRVMEECGLSGYFFSRYPHQFSGGQRQRIGIDLSVVKYISDRIGVMYLGNMVELAETEALFGRTMHPYTEALLSAIPTSDENDTRERILLEGDIPSPVNPPPGCKFHTRCRCCRQKCKEEEPVFEDKGEGHFVACHFPLNQ